MAYVFSPRQGPRCSYWGVRRGQNQCLMSAWFGHHNTWKLCPSPDHAWLILPRCRQPHWVSAAHCWQLHCLQTIWQWLFRFSILLTCTDQCRQNCCGAVAADNGKMFCPITVCRQWQECSCLNIKCSSLLVNWSKCRRWLVVLTILTLRQPQGGVYCCRDCIALHLRSSINRTVFLRRRVHFYSLLVKREGFSLLTVIAD